MANPDKNLAICLLPLQWKAKAASNKSQSRGKGVSVDLRSSRKSEKIVIYLWYGGPTPDPSEEGMALPVLCISTNQATRHLPS